MAELKPCPFCGGEAKVAFAHPWYMLKRLHNRYVFAGCPKCGIATNLYLANNRTGSPLINKAHEEGAKEKAIEAWNRRTESEELKFTRDFIHEHGLDFALASAWNRRANDD